MKLLDSYEKYEYYDDETVSDFVFSLTTTTTTTTGKETFSTLSSAVTNANETRDLFFASLIFIIILTVLIGILCFVINKIKKSIPNIVG